MSLFARYAGLSVASPWVKPTLVQIGSPPGGGFATASYGYDITPGTGAGGASSHWYVDRDLHADPLQKKFYWELDHQISTSADQVLWGIMKNPTTAQLYLGYSALNAGVYFDTTLWAEPAWAATWSPTSLSPGLGAGAVVGFAYDASAKTLQVLANNVLRATLTIGSPPAALWAGMTWQGNTGLVKLRLGLGNTLYSPPGGYDFL